MIDDGLFFFRFIVLLISCLYLPINVRLAISIHYCISRIFIGAGRVSDTSCYKFDASFFFFLILDFGCGSCLMCTLGIHLLLYGFIA